MFVVFLLWELPSIRRRSKTKPGSSFIDCGAGKTLAQRYRVEGITQGLGYHKEIVNIYLDHLAQALKGL